MESLKQELLQSQQTRDSFMKYKLLLVSGIGAVGLGFSKSSPVPQAELVLCLIPIACCYVDLLCRNLSLRTKLLSRFFFEENRYADRVEARFECFYQKFDKTRGKGRKENALEGFALLFSTLFLSVAIIPVGIMITSKGQCIYNWRSLLFVIAGIAGLLISRLINSEYQTQKDLIEDEQRSKEWHDACKRESSANQANLPTQENRAAD